MDELVKLRDDVIGFSISVPKDWTVVTKEELAQHGSDPRTLFKLRLPTGSLIIVTYDGVCSEDQFDDAYQSNLNNLGEHGVIHNEQTIMHPNGRKVKRAFYDLKAPDGSIVRMCHNFTIINNFFIDFNGGKIDASINTDNLGALMNDPLAVQLHTLLGSVTVNQPPVSKA